MDTKELLLRAARLLEAIEEAYLPQHASMTRASCHDCVTQLRLAAADPTTTTGAPDTQEGPPREAALEAAAELAETWGGAPPSPAGRRAALAAAIRKLKIP